MTYLLQPQNFELGIPDPGSRTVVLVIGAFILAVGVLLIYARIRELEE